MTFRRYRRIDKVTRVISNDDDIAAFRQAQVRKKLYFITLVVTVIVVPLVTALMIFYLLIGGDYWAKPYDFDSFHFGPDPFNASFISFTTSDMMSWVEFCSDYIGLLAGIFLAIPFGTTTEAINMYRRCLVAIGLGYVCPKLRKVYTPSMKRKSKVGWWSSATRTLGGKSLLTSRYGSLLPLSRLSVTNRPLTPQHQRRIYLQRPPEPKCLLLNCLANAN